ncbi:aldehyde dehydrogenase family protein [Tropicibacter sp. R15_0]|uniref:aldehyde dehydrogenase family protein n=1 Tax=Tropicibacter sp. R15_0 TaxID=2821101 RepID=UPI001ADBBC95|nr:aldehyde dehydrogenase family protein [Tropicibacter sp. R15_0]MBO9467803.1 aldehyde dehydrogenase family protein [Tropicibacter sp. R15_0]
MTFAFDPSTISLPNGHYIGGRYVDAPKELAVHTPSDGRLLTDIPCGDQETVNQAVNAAKTALRESGWATVTPRERVKALHAWADLIEAEANTLAQLEAICSSRPVGQARVGDVGITATQIRFFAEFADKECGALAPTSGDQLGFISHEPYGVVGAITPWNYPISMAGWKLGPALAAGNAVVLKPSEMTPFSTLYLAELAERAGLPKGLINIVLGNGPETGAAITGHPDIAKVSFTGSTRAGSAIMENIAQSGIKPMTLELGGKSPQIVFADADLDKAADCIARGILPNAGQTCVAGTRVLVHHSLADALAAKLVTAFDAQKPAATWDDPAGFSPIISAGQMRRIDSIVQASIAAGADCLTGGQAFERPGSYYQPTLLSGVTEENPAVKEEIFGPVATFQTFDSDDEAIALANHPTYGLCAGVYTQDLSRAVRVTRALETGTVWVNRYGRSYDHILPTGGWKSSGIGKDLGREAFLANQRSKSVLIDL